jgi:V8-like Glu-specific endopeptidase
MSNEINLSYEENRDLVEVLSNLYDFTDGARSARVFIQDTAKLGRFVPGTNWNSTPRTLVTELVNKLARWDFLPERPTYHALGALLSAVEGLPEVSPESKTLLSQVIIRHGLVRDPKYIADLRNRYKIIDVPPPLSPAEAAFLPAADTPVQPGPAFNAQVPDQAGLEEVLHSEDNFLDIYILEGAVQASLAVGLVECPEGNPHGTGFLINHDLLLTNQHVLKDKAMLADACVRFGYREDANKVRQPGRVVPVKPDLYESSPAEQLDYALVQLAERPLQDLVMVGQHRGYLPLAPRIMYDKERVNIIQHPGGDPLKVVLTQNRVVLNMTDTRLQYVADTMDGSSGSPVLNNLWQVVALHHSGIPYPPDSPATAAKKVWKGIMRVNEGIPIKAILADLKAKKLDRLLPSGL